MQSVVLVLIVAASSYILYLWRNYIKNRPGPWGLPIIGHLPLLGTEPQKKLLKWAEIYGPVYFIRFGSYPAVVINNGILIRKAFRQVEFSGRPRIEFYDKMSWDRAGLAWADGPIAHKLNSLTQKCLTDLSTGINAMEIRLLLQIPPILEEFERHLNQPESMPMKKIFCLHTVSYLCNVIMGVKFTANHPVFRKCIQATDELVTQYNAETLPNKTFLGAFIPILGRWFPKQTGIQRIWESTNEFLGIIEYIIEQHMKTRAPGQPRDVIDAYVDELEQCKNESIVHTIKNHNLAAVITELFIAGIGTSSSALEWIIYHVVKYPKVQAIIQAEIDHVIGKDRLPAIHDRANMPYTQAVIRETLRITSFTPFGLLHSTTKDVVFEGIAIPKDTLVIPNFYAAHHDPNVWASPEEFRPERFIQDGRLRRREDFMPYSTGKRACLGEELATNQLFIFIVSILQCYSLQSDGELPPQRGVFGIVVGVEPFNVFVNGRD